MKLSICLFLAFVGLAVSAKVPTFTWLQAEFSPAGVPLLSVDFHDGKPSDVAVLKQFNPIPKQRKELEKNIDKCIFKGNLRDEPTVVVTLTGGCPFEKNFDVMFLSERSSEYKFQVKDMMTHVISPIFKTKGLFMDEAKMPPASAAKPFKNPEVAPANGYNLAVEMNFDGRFKEKFGEDSWNAVRRIAAHATNMYTWSSLATTLNWQISNVYEVPESGITASSDWLEYISTYNNAEVNSNVYFGYRNDQPGTVGLAWLGTICSSTSYRTAVCEYFNNDMSSAEILAHEVGHNTGMSHDFNGSPGSPRYDSQGRTCTDIGGVMDYYQTVTKWSSCSNEDFNSNDHSCL